VLVQAIEERLGHTFGASSPPAASGSTAAMAMLRAHSLPVQASETLPGFPAFHDAHKDVVVAGDAFPKPAGDHPCVTGRLLVAVAYKSSFLHAGSRAPV
jgi:hypothetical protein